MLYTNIQKKFQLHPITERIFITKNNKWIIGPYTQLRLFASKLRYRDDLNRDDLIEKLVKLDVIFGERKTDAAPVGAVQKGGFIQAIRGKEEEQSAAELEKLYGNKPNRKGKPFIPRLTDQFQKAKDWYQNRTLESHHIVEKSLLEKINANKGDLADAVAPCVLVVAEMHRRLYTAEIARQRGSITNTMSRSEVKSKLFPMYRQLYARPVFSDLREIAELIIKSTVLQ